MGVGMTRTPTQGSSKDLLTKKTHASSSSAGTASGGCLVATEQVAAKATQVLAWILARSEWLGIDP
eukprot:12912629-Prorocentrum_lima.AAC.1